MSTKTLGKGRKFLSSDFNEGSTITWYVGEWAYGVDSQHTDMDAYVKIRDCDRSIRLDFDVDSEKQRKQRLKKLDNLITELTKMRECIVEGDLR